MKKISILILIYTLIFQGSASANDDSQDKDDKNTTTIVISTIAGAAVAAGVVTCVILFRADRSCARFSRKTTSLSDILGEKSAKETKKLVGEFSKNIQSQEIWKQTTAKSNQVWDAGGEGGQELRKAIRKAFKKNWKSGSTGKVFTVLFQLDNRQMHAMITKAVTDLELAQLIKILDDVIGEMDVKQTAEAINTAFRNLDVGKVVDTLEERITHTQRLKMGEVSFKDMLDKASVPAKLASNEGLHKVLKKQISTLKEAIEIDKITTMRDELLPLLDKDQIIFKLQELVVGIYDNPNLRNTMRDVSYLKGVDDIENAGRSELLEIIDDIDDILSEAVEKGEEIASGLR